MGENETCRGMSHPPLNMKNGRLRETKKEKSKVEGKVCVGREERKPEYEEKKQKQGEKKNGKKEEKRRKMRKKENEERERKEEKVGVSHRQQTRGEEPGIALQ